MLDTEGHVRTWNRGARAHQGLLGRRDHRPPLLRLLSARGSTARASTTSSPIATSEGRFEDEGWRLRKDGTRFWANVVITRAARRERHARRLRQGDARPHRAPARPRRRCARARSASACSSRACGTTRSSCSTRTATSQTWNVGAAAASRAIAPTRSSAGTSRSSTRRGGRARASCERELEVAATRGPLRGRGLARAQGRHALLGQRRHHARCATAPATLVGFAKVTRDLTERKRAEDERLALARAHEAIRLRDEFLSIASHELRTPLTALQLQIQRLREAAGRRQDGDGAGAGRPVDAAPRRAGRDAARRRAHLHRALHA